MVVKVAELLEVGVLQQLGRGPPLVFVVDQHLGDDFLALRRHVLDAVANALALFTWIKVDLHVSCVPRKVVQELFVRCPDGLVDLVDLVELVLAGEQRAQTEHFVHDAADAPNVHLVGVISVREQALRRAIPPGRNVLGQRHVLVEAAAAAEIGELDGFAVEQNVLRLDVAVEDAEAVHVVNGLQQLVGVVLHALFW